MDRRSRRSRRLSEPRRVTAVEQGLSSRESSRPQARLPQIWRLVAEAVCVEHARIGAVEAVEDGHIVGAKGKVEDVEVLDHAQGI